MERIEDMRAFFAARVDTYDEHMRTNIPGMCEAYDRVAAQLPEGTRTLLDLGCGTGLELDAVFARFPAMAVTGIDLTPEMLDQLRAKHADRELRLICGSYFDVDFGKAQYDAAISVESLHHFSYARKLPLYRRLHAALRPGGVYVEADYMVTTQAEEDAMFAARDALLAQARDQDGGWHIDTPLTVAHQRQLLAEAGFSDVQIRWRHVGTVILRAWA